MSTSIKSRKHALTQATAQSLTAAALFGLVAPAALAVESVADPVAEAAPIAGAEQATTLDKLNVHGTRYGVDRVASNKFTQSIKDTPQTIQVISRDLFNEQGASNDYLLRQ